MSNTIIEYAVYVAGKENMELYGKFPTPEKAIQAAENRRKFGCTGLISVEKITHELIYTA